MMQVSDRTFEDVTSGDYAAVMFSTTT